MKKNFLFTAAACALMTGASLPALAGNMPQYMFSAEKGTYTPIQGGITIPCSWSVGTYYVLPGGGENPNDCESDGWDLGMTFRFGGQEFDRFIVTNQGRLILGKGTVNTETAFTVNFSNVMHGLASGKITYKVDGTPGNRIFTLQYADCVTAETTKFKGEYNLQIKLYEADQKVETVFDQIEAPWANGMGFNLGIVGWNDDDVLRIHGRSLLLFDTLETGKGLPNMLYGDTYVRWDNQYEDPFTVKYTFTPDLSTVVPAGSPSGLQLKQTGSTINVTCERDEEAPATVILWSNQPFTSSDYPTDGVTFNAGETTVFGNAHAVYYGDDETISVDIEGVSPNTDYYVQAISVSGYPMYNTANPIEAMYHTTQAAPTMLSVTPIDATQLKIRLRAADPVIVAQTTQVERGFEHGYLGVFGRPEAEMTEGDIIDGGGQVIYAGDVQELTVTVEKNQLNYFRAWTVKDGIVSATHIDGAGVPEASLPYKPGVENYPLGLALLGWDATSGQFLPYTMMYNKVDALRAYSVNGARLELTSPVLDLSKPTKLTCQFALETERGADASGVNLGTEPGRFGPDGYLKVMVNGVEYGMVNQYNGTMVSNGLDGYETGSNTFQEFTVELPAIGEASVSFVYRADTSSYLWLRDIEVYDPNDVGVGTISEDEKALDFTQPVYTVTGMRVRAASASELPFGLYIVGGRKVIIK